MNGIEALYKCMNDPDLEFESKIFSKWFTYVEWRETCNVPSRVFLFETGAHVHKRQSPIDACLETLLDIPIDSYTKENLKEILLKHWPKEN